MLVFKNDYFEITEEHGKVYLTTAMSGFPLKEFDSILRSFPRIKLTNFTLLKNALSTSRWCKNQLCERRNLTVVNFTTGEKVSKKSIPSV